MKKLLALLLALVMVVALAACGNKPVETKATDPAPTESKQEETEPALPVDPYAGMDHAEVSEILYDQILGEFYDYYLKGTEEAKTVSERYAYMAIAEAKLMESGVFQPGTCQGGNYAISRVAPYTVSPCLWGMDTYRYHNAVIVNEDPITAEERNEMKAKYAELKGTGEYEAWVKDYLLGKGYTLNDTYTLSYPSDPATWDPMNTYLSADSEGIVPTIDALVEYDGENVMQPALAEEWSVSDDGLVYTFKIREGVNWVDSQGRVIEPLTAQSFVAGFQHMLDAQGGLEYLVDGVIEGASEYMYEGMTDFTQVGVKAIDDYTLEYTLCEPFTYFMTMLTYNIFFPMSEKYFLANGGAFGLEEFSAASQAEEYVYGTAPEYIAYCGPYLITSFAAENSIVFTANPSYWNADNINIKKIEWVFLSGQNPTEAYDNMKAGTFAGAGLNTNALAKAKEDGMFDKYAYVSATDATSYMAFFNVYRCQYANFNDETAVVSTMNDLDKIRTNLAMQNQNFRLALCHALDRGAYNATTVGDELKYNSLINGYTPGTFVTLEEDVTVAINGTDTTFKKGTFYGQIVQAQIDADGFKMKVFDETADGGIGSSAGYDGWYNVEAAVEYINAAVEELKELNVEISAENPIIIELPYYDVSETYTNRANAFEQSTEASLNGLVDVVLVKCGGSNALNWYNAGYYPDTGDLMNYNVGDLSGWGPDYGDPATYLNTMLPQGGGMAKGIGLY